MNRPNDIKLVGLTGGVWAVPEPTQQPLVHLECWKVFQLDNGDYHLLGWHGAEIEGRVSLPVVSLDSSRRQALTLSGRIYELAGSYGCNADALYVWNKRLEANGNVLATDVTQEFVRRIDESWH